MNEGTVQRFSLPLRDGTSYDFDGQRLGSGSSEATGKTRWFEVDIYLKDNGTFLLYTAGRSTHEGEQPLLRLIETKSAFEIADRMIVAHPDRRNPRNPDLVYIPSQSLRALTTAAQWNDDLLEALRELPTMIAARQAGSSRG